MRCLNRLRQVREQLNGDSGDVRDRLRSAGCNFLVAANERESWPASLRIEAEWLRAGLLAIGVSDDGAADTDQGEVEAMIRDLLRFCQRAERNLRGTHGRQNRPLCTTLPFCPEEKRPFGPLHQ